MELEIKNEETLDEGLLEEMEQAAICCLRNEGIDGDNCVISVSFVSPEQIHQMNRDYRGVDKVTDVLSFPQFEDIDEIIDACGTPFPAELGDVLINLDRVKEQAEEFGHSFERELLYLFTHSVLHLLGYDHIEEDERAVMREREEAVMDELGVARDDSPWTDHSDDFDGEWENHFQSVGRFKLATAETSNYAGLYDLAQDAMENAYAPYSGFRVGAALLTEEGRIFKGVNVENASYGAAICAERTAAVTAVAAGFRNFKAIAIASSNGDVSMCGICRQFLAEFSRDLDVITGPDRDHLKVTSLSQLLPDDFSRESME